MMKLSAVMDCAANGYTLHHVPRSSGRRGGGVGVLTNNSIKMTSCLQPVNVAQSFESISVANLAALGCVRFCFFNIFNA